MRSAALALAVATVMLAAGCGAVRVAPLEEALLAGALKSGEPIERAEPARPPRAVLVERPADERGTAMVPSAWHRVPLVGAVGMFAAETHDRPEVTAAVTPGALGRGGMAVQGDLPAALARMLAEAMEDTGAVARADYVADVGPDHDPRRYDYIIRGRLREGSLDVRRMDWGLNAWHLINLSPLAHAIGLPDAASRGRVVWDIELVERVSGRVALRRTLEWQGEWRSIGWYGEARATAGLVGVGLGEPLGRSLWETAREVGRAAE